MNAGSRIAEVAALVGDPARANMLAAVMDGSALTASELAYLSGVAPPTASAHLAKLAEAGLLTVAKQGRHRYFRLASPPVARMLESIMVFASHEATRQRRPWRGGAALRHARTCYDHLAGRVAVAVVDRLVERAFVLLDEDGAQLTEAGRAFLAGSGIVIRTPAGRRVFCRPCLDWSERRPHLAGAVGAAILSHAFEHAWVERIRDSRALALTPVGIDGFKRVFGVDAAA